MANNRHQQPLEQSEILTGVILLKIIDERTLHNSAVMQNTGQNIFNKMLKRFSSKKKHLDQNAYGCALP